MKTINTEKNAPILPFEATNAYISGKMKPKTKAQADEILANCELSQEAMEGLQGIEPKIFAADVNELSKRLNERTGGSDIIPIPTEKLMINFGQVAAIAAALVVVGMAAWVLTSPKIDFFNSIRGQLAFEKTAETPTAADQLSTDAQSAGSITFGDGSTQPDSSAKTASARQNAALQAATLQTTTTGTASTVLEAEPAPTTTEMTKPSEDMMAERASSGGIPANSSRLEADAEKLKAAEQKRKLQAANKTTLPAPVQNNQQNTNTNYGDIKNTEIKDQTTAKYDANAEASASATDSQAEFPGGRGALQTYLISQSAYPRKLADDPEKPQGKVTVSFDVNERGKIENVYVVQGVNEILDKKAIAAVKEMPRWTPASKNGKKAKTRQTVSLNFAP